MTSPRPRVVAAPAPEASARADDALAFLAELSRSLAVSLDLQQTLSEVITRLRDFLGVEGIALFLFDARREVLECRICSGPVDVAGMRLAPGQGVVGRAAAEDATQLVTDAANDARVWRAADEATGFATRSLVCAPLRTAAGPIGVIEIVNRRDGRPFSSADARLLELVAAPAALAINSARMAGELLEQQRLKREFDLARHLQKSLLPRRRRDDFPVLGVNRPAHEMSGDFFDHFELADGRIAFVIGDVSGKGLDAALLMVRAAGLLRWIGKQGLAPSAWLAQANQELVETVREGRFVCVVVGYCDRAATRVQFASAGFPPILVHRDGQWSEQIADGPPLGIVAGIEFAQHEVELGDGVFYAFSDGATDVRDANGARIGLEGLRALIDRHAQQSPAARVRALLGDLRRMHLVDDTTLLLIQAPQAELPELLYTRVLPARADALRALRVELRAAFDAQHIEPTLRDRLVLAVDEACTNIIRHGYGACGEGVIALRALRHDAVLTIELVDSAPLTDPARLKPGTLGECRSGGLGIAFIDTIMDQWHIEPLADGSGNRLVLCKRIESWSHAEADEA
ncbi:MAG: SpoIIE family protein phosphatase [Dokdonella sp.]|uniref:ATP-binding SpoIIE family protein phosphatase n=1 Tax=Dokdonella sp. TaxID=2291710 RepID=UPI0025BCCEB2|nr:SpoIIE family protein phosphatase [Dokdonella sp.]MBZ0223737.1 SpoIIE family protein phosphatase [Dokdonella sp.]MCC7254353.1 SpoIIE family protein phosphatase [Dokdonella sp.]